MSTLLHSLRDFSCSLLVADEPALSSVLAQFAELIGANHYVVGLRTGVAVDFKRMVFQTSLPIDWVEAYRRPEVTESDPHYARILQSLAPYIWLPAEPSKEGRSASAYRALMQRRSADAILVLPIDRLGPIVLGGAFVMDSYEREISPEEMRAACNVLRTIVLLNKAAYARNYVSQNSLSEQDVRIINLIAEGKSNWAIANILDMKELKLKGLVRGLMEKFSLLSRSDVQHWAYMSGIYMLASSTDRGGSEWTSE